MKGIVGGFFWGKDCADTQRPLGFATTVSIDGTSLDVQNLTTFTIVLNRFLQSILTCQN